MIESGTVTRSWQRQAFEPLEDEEESSALQQQFRKTLSQPDPPAPDYTLTVLQNLAMATSSEPPPQGSDSWMAAATAEPPETPAAIGTELPLPRSQSDAEAASNGAASDAGDRSADWAFIQRHDAYAARMDEFRAEYSALSSFRGGVGQGFLDYANEMTLANLREPQWADEEFASIESQGWSLPEAAAKAAAGSSGQPRSSAQPAVNWAEADRADAAGSVDLRTASGHFVPDTQHDAVLAGINAERGINPHGTTPRGEEASPQFAEASSSGPTYGEFGEEIPPAQQIVIVGQRPPAYADTIAERIGGTLGALYNLGNALGEGIKDQVSDSQSSTSDLAAMRSARQAAAGATSSIAALDSSELTSPNTNAAELLGNLPELLVAPDTSSYYDDSDARTWSPEVQKRLDDTLKGNNEDWTASTRMSGKTTFILAGWLGMNVAG